MKDCEEIYCTRRVCRDKGGVAHAMLLYPGVSPASGLPLLQIVMLMRTPPGVEDDRLAKAALFTKYVGEWAGHGGSAHCG